MSLRIVFMGTPDFAVPSLDILVKNGFKVVGVVTVSDKMGGRGMKQVLQSPVKKYAVEHDIPVLQPEKLKNPAFLDELRALQADLFIVVAFRMLPEVVWTMPPKGTFNLHGSLLPRYRGAAPINWAVINGDTETGVTTFFLQHEIDTGQIIFQDHLPIGPDDTAGEIHDRMMLLGAQTVLKTVQAMDQGTVSSQPQIDSKATHAPKIFHETCEIDFNRSSQDIHNFIRGLSPYPAAWTTLDGLEFKVLKSKMELAAHGHEAGKVISDGKSELKWACANGYIHALEVQLQGRKRMGIRDFLNGYSLGGH
jgi:methionyl-tRNA formyltransferase